MTIYKAVGKEEGLALLDAITELKLGAPKVYSKQAKERAQEELNKMGDLYGLKNSCKWGRAGYLKGIIKS